MLSTLSFLSLLIACGEKDITTDTGSTSTDTGTENTDTGLEDTDTSDTQDTTDTQDTSDTTDTQDTNTGNTVEGLNMSGSYTGTATSSSISVASCDNPVNFTQVSTSASNAPTVLIAHGFFRSPDNMIEWGNHLATWGVNALVIEMCTLFDHQTNGMVLSEIPSALGISDYLYLGFSAGGLASLVAGANSSPLGIVTLDPVEDMNGTGSTIGQINVPVVGVIGEPSDCNSQNNGITLLQSVGASTILRVTDADHCDFEGPTDETCEDGLFGIGACANTLANISDDSIRGTIRTLGTAGILWLGGLDSSAEDYWTGSAMQSLQSQGLISPL